MRHGDGEHCRWMAAERSALRPVLRRPPGPPHRPRSRRRARRTTAAPDAPAARAGTGTDKVHLGSLHLEGVAIISVAVGPLFDAETLDGSPGLSHIDRATGGAFGRALAARECSTAMYDQWWGTLDGSFASPRLLVIGPYRMGFVIAIHDGSSQLTVFIDYDLPDTGAARWLGRMLNLAVCYGGGIIEDSAGGRRPA